VYAASRPAPAGARPYAIVGPRPTVRTADGGTPPQISVSATPGATKGAHAEVALTNRSSVPQYQLQVYAFARHHGRYVAAGALTVPHLGSDGHHTVQVPVLGNAGHARLRLQAVATIAS
jgi:hypothetical protein